MSNYNFVDNIITLHEQNEAIKTGEELIKTPEGQINLIKRAGNGDMKCVNYLFMRFAGLLYKSELWVYNNDKDLLRQAYISGKLLDDIIFAYMLLQGRQNELGYKKTYVGRKRKGLVKDKTFPNIYEKFNPSIYNPNKLKRPDQIITSFLYMANLYFRMQIRAIHIQEDKANKIPDKDTGKALPTSGDVVVGFNKTGEDSVKEFDLGADDPGFKNVEINILIKQLVEQLEKDNHNQAATYIRLALIEKRSLSYVAKALNITEKRAKKIQKNIQELILKYIN